MFNNYFKTATRNLWRHKTFSLINILGLSLSIACFTIITFYINDELSYDAIHADSKRIHRLLEVSSKQGEPTTKAQVSPRIGPESNKNFLEVEDVCRVFQIGFTVFEYKSESFNEEFYVFDKNFFNFFDFELISGDKATVLDDPTSVVLSESYVKKYFGNEPPIGKTLINRTNLGDFQLTVTGVVKDFPGNSHIKFNMLFPEKSLERIFTWYKGWESTDWNTNTWITYLKLSPDIDLNSLENKILNLATDNKQETAGLGYHLQPLEDIHFHSSQVEGGMNLSPGNLRYVYIFFSIGLLIILVACINYLNLSSVQIIKRTREIGLRRIIGARFQNLFSQFISESILLQGIVIILAITFLQLLTPLFNQIAGKSVGFLDINAWLLAGILIFVFLLVLFSGVFPLILLMKSKTSLFIRRQGGKGKLGLQKGLVVFQFVISTMLIISTAVIYQQLDYINNKDIGYDSEQMIVIEINSNNARRSEESIISDFKNLASVVNASASSRVPTEWKIYPKLNVADENGDIVISDAPFLGVDENFIDTYNIKLATGRNFSGTIVDTSAVIINQTAASLLGIDELEFETIDIVGGQIGSNNFTEDGYNPRVIGIIEDFHFQSLRQKIPPIIMGYKQNPIQNIDYFSVRMAPGNQQETIDPLKEAMKKYDPSPFEFNFLDTKLREFYTLDQTRGKLFLFASVVAVFIACIGLFAMTVFMIEQRIKEVGVRKVLGASTRSIVFLLSRQFSILLAISFVLAIPIAIYFSNGWLEDFAYRINISWKVLTGAVLITFLVVLSTIGYNTIKAAMTNPVDSIGHE